MEQIRVGVIGTGRMGQNHCRVYSSLRFAALAGVCDQNQEVGHSMANKYGSRYFADLDDMLEHVDAVSIAVPTPGHFALAMRCLERGAHVFVEKPITETLPQAEALTAAAERSGLVVQVGHIERFNPTYVELQNVLDGMTTVAVNFKRLSPYVGSNLDVDVVLDLMIHDLDLVLDMIGHEPVTLTAHGITASDGAVDHALVSLPCAPGPLVTLTASRLTEQKVRLIEVTTLEAYVLADLLDKSISVHRSMTGEYLNQNQRSVKYRQESLVERIHVPAAEPLLLELQHFIDCVQHGKTPLVTARHGMRALRLATQIRQELHGHMADFTMRLSKRHGVVSLPKMSQAA
jgi:virulence factor